MSLLPILCFGLLAQVTPATSVPLPKSIVRHQMQIEKEYAEMRAVYRLAVERANKKDLIGAAQQFELFARKYPTGWLHERPIPFGTDFLAAQMYAQAGCQEECFRALKRSFEGAPLVSDISMWPEFKPFHTHPEWPAIERAWRECHGRPIPLEERMLGLTRVYHYVKNGFIFFDFKPSLVWDQAYAQAVAEASKTGDRFQYYKTVSTLLSKLGDGHTQAWEPPDLNPWGQFGITGTYLDDKIHLTKVYDSAKRGVPLFTTVEAIEGEDPLKYLEKHERWRSYGGNPQVDRKNLVNMMGSAVKGQRRRFTLRTPDGKTFQKTLRAVDPFSMKGQWTEVKPQSPAESLKSLPPDIAYHNIRTFSSGEDTETFVKRISEFRSKKGLILDLRRNGGGSDEHSFRVASHLLSHTVASASWLERRRRGGQTSWGIASGADPKRKQEAIGFAFEAHAGDPVQPVEPEQRYTGPLVILVSNYTASAAEDLLVVLRDREGCVKMGEASYGSTGNPLFISQICRGGPSVRICSKRDYLPNGDDFVGVGIQPDVPFSQTLSTFQSERDELLEKAIDSLRNLP